MVQDNSVDFEETWAFLDNRMKETQTFGHNFKQVGECIHVLTLHVLNTRWLYIRMWTGFCFQFQGVLWGGVKMLTARIAMVSNATPLYRCGFDVNNYYSLTIRLVTRQG